MYQAGLKTTGSVIVLYICDNKNMYMYPTAAVFVKTFRHFLKYISRCSFQFWSFVRQ